MALGSGIVPEEGRSVAGILAIGPPYCVARGGRRSASRSDELDPCKIAPISR